MKTRLAPGLAIANSRIEGQGCFATQYFAKRAKIAEYTGELISDEQAVRRAYDGRKRLRICAINNQWSLDGSIGGNGTHYINHSCDPNSFMRITYNHILFFAMRAIHPGDEITLDYVQTYHSDQKRCRCGAHNCRGTINKPQP